ncbi:hypothetical protein KDA_68400 [Dictyobacter alpinus]|uniref:non-specific serine/threonine protein kinase n=1 Tax=Dictyobacter alpinus TaxID=2014873 RepID=A0A402BJ41_9CHLR|nr:serine/threonine-protein kinase [Dictyobacter alpinus]GCE31356.1 hypothetical protein KDA_68400 [Dictyobacter alpinus]
MPSWAGQQLGNYRLIRRIGRGGSGQVYLGEHIYLKTYAAIKLLLENDGEERQVESFKTAFLHEARKIASLKHPHILRVLEFGIEMSTPYLVMEYAAHGTLLDRHPRGTRVVLKQVVTYTKQIAQALHYAHQVRLIHRDVKPANVLLDEYDTLLLSDFGIATIAHRTSSMRTSPYAGTAAYMAPEQLRGKPVPASDQYALAIMIYEWLCGQLPYQGDLIMMGMQHLTAPIPSLRIHNKTLSPSIEAVVHQAMAKDPRQRFSSILEFALALEETSRAPQQSINDTILFQSVLSQPPSPPPSTKIAPPISQKQPVLSAKNSTSGSKFSRRAAIAGLVTVGLGAGITWEALKYFAVSPPDCGTAFSDDFQGNIHPGWTWVDPTNRSIYRITAPGTLSITAPTNADLNAQTNFQAPRLLQPIRGNFTLETLVEVAASPPLSFWEVGLVIWQDQDNFLRVGLNTRTFDFEQVANGVFRHNAPDALAGATIRTSQAELKILRSNDTFSAYYRLPEKTWQLINTTNIHLQNLQVGPLLVNIAESPFTAYYHYVRVTCN